MEIDYLTQSNIWKTVSGHIGTVDFQTSEVENEVIFRSNVLFDMDFNNDKTRMRMSTEFFSTYAGSNVKVKAYGYSKP